MNVQNYLDEMGARYALSQHDPAYTAQALAESEHISGRLVIKPVIVRADGRFVLCALPACYRVDLGKMRDLLNASEVSLVEESMLGDLFPDCELGAQPPIGRMFGLTTFMDSSVFDDEKVTFQAGRHDLAITMPLSDYRRVSQPRIAQFGRPA